MERRVLRHSGSFDPHWFNRYRSGRFVAQADSTGHICLDGVTFGVDGAPLEAGTDVLVWLEQTFVCVPLEEVRAEQARQKERDAAQDAAQRQRRNEARQHAERFNSRLELPVRWTAGIKSVLSGLSDRSWGDGRRATTVTHVLLLEPLRAGRLCRQAGDFLCAPGASANGKRWVEAETTAYDGEQQPYTPVVTCVTCLRLARPWTSPGDTCDDAAPAP